MKVKEGLVHGRIGPVKTEYSEDELPLGPDFATILLEIKRRSNGSSLLFPNPRPDVLIMLLQFSRTTSAARDVSCGVPSLRGVSRDGMHRS